jgi:hypothetical protein
MQPAGTVPARTLKELHMIRSIAAALAAFALISFAATAEEAAKVPEKKEEKKVEKKAEEKKVEKKTEEKKEEKK